MSSRPSSQVDLAKLFNTVTAVLKENQESLNAADTYNHNHGDNMVENFQTITKAVRAKKNSDPTDQLANAGEQLRQRAQSGSAQLYSEGLVQAADRLKDRPAITQEDALMLLQALMSGQNAAPQTQTGRQDPRGGFGGGQPEQAANADLLNDLLGALMGGSAKAQTQQQPAGPGASGIDLGMLMTAGQTFMQARQQGAEPVQALVQAVMAGSQMQGNSHRAQSGQLVAETLINTLGSMFSGKKKRR